MPVHVVRENRPDDPEQPWTTVPERSLRAMYPEAEVVFTAEPK